MPELLFNDYYYLRIILAFDAVWHLYNYNSDYIAPNWGFEITLLEILSLRYGQERRQEIFCVYPNFHKINIRRMGVGINIPLKMIMAIEKNINFLFDIVFSRWGTMRHEALEKPFFTIQLVYDFTK